LSLPDWVNTGNGGWLSTVLPQICTDASYKVSATGMLPFVQIDCLLTSPEDGDKAASRIFLELLTSTTEPMISPAASSNK
jgi:hypothetical protein